MARIVDPAPRWPYPRPESGQGMTGVVTLAVLGVLVLLGAIGWRVWSVRTGRQRAIAALAAECPGMDDRLEGRDITLLFSNTEEMLGLASHRLLKLLPFSLIRKWRTEPVYNSKDRRVGWNFIIETADTQEPIWTIRMRSGPGNTVPNLWMAKFSAHMNG